MTMSQQCAIATKVSDEEESCQQIEGIDPAPLLSTGEAIAGKCWVQFCTSQYRRHIELLEGVQQRDTKIIRGLQCIAFEERQSELGEEKAQGNISISKYLKGARQRARHFLVVPSDRTRGNGPKLKNTLPLSIRKHFFTMRVTEHCCRLPRKVVESHSLKILKHCLDVVLGCRCPSLSRRLTQVIFRGCFQSQSQNHRLF